MLYTTENTDIITHVQNLYYEKLHHIKEAAPFGTASFIFKNRQDLSFTNGTSEIHWEFWWVLALLYRAKCRFIFLDIVFQSV